MTIYAIVQKPYFVVKRGMVKNDVQNLCGKSGKIIKWKLNGSVFAEFDGEVYELPLDTYKICIK